MPERLYNPSGGYRDLKAYQLSEIIYDATVAFARLYLDKRSRTVDQMVQAARSGKQNIAEGNRAAATSRQSEIRLINVARSSLEELLLDYEDFLRQNALEQWHKDHPKSVFIRKLRHPSTKAEASDPTDPTDPTESLAHGDMLNQGPIDHTHPTDPTDQKLKKVRQIPYDTYRPYVESKGSETAANTVICLINQACFLLDKYLQNREQIYEQSGGFTERMYRLRSEARNSRPPRQS